MAVASDVQAQFDSLTARLEAQERENELQRTEIERLTAIAHAGGVPLWSEEPQAVGGATRNRRDRLRLNLSGNASTRRDLFKIAGAAAATAAGATVMSAEPAAAIDGDTLKIGNNDASTNTGTHATELAAGTSFVSTTLFVADANTNSNSGNITAIQATGANNGTGGGAPGAGVVGQGGSGTANNVHGATGIVGQGGAPNGTGQAGIGVSATGGNTGTANESAGSGLSATGGSGSANNASGGDGVTGKGGSASGIGTPGNGVIAIGGNAANLGQTPGRGLRGIGGSGFANDVPGAAGVRADGGSGIGTGAGAPGLQAQGGPGGTSGSDGPGIIATGGGTNGDGAVLQGSGTGVPLNLLPNLVPGPPTSGVHVAGDLMTDSNSVLWVCFANGTPGTWARLTSVPSTGIGGAINYLPNPVRVIDTRGSQQVGPFTGPLARNTFTTFGPFTSAPGNLPTGITGLLGNLSAIGMPGGGYITIYPAGQAIPSTGTVSFGPQVYSWSNSFTVAVGTAGNAGKVSVFVSDNVAVDVAIDITGFVM